MQWVDGTGSRSFQFHKAISCSRIVVSRIRLYSTKTFKHLGTLEYHKKSVQAVVFARYSGHSAVDGDGGENSDDEMTPEEKKSRSRWLAGGSQDNRVTLWPLISFDK